jgi:hypothetical protein
VGLEVLDRALASTHLAEQRARLRIALLMDDGLEELVDPQAAREPGGAGGREDVVGADRLVAA